MSANVQNVPPEEVRENVPAGDTADESTDFDAGFDLDGSEAEDSSTSADDPQPGAGSEGAPFTGQEGAPPVDRPTTGPQAPPIYVPEQQEQPAPAPRPAVQTAPVEIPAEMKDEFEALKRLSPEAAALAQEDSPEGAQVRDRLSEVGAISAQDRAEILMVERRQTLRMQAEMHRAVEAQSRYMQELMQRDHAELLSMQEVEKALFMRDMRAWIEKKPYAQAKNMMYIFESGTDPRQVSGLITQYKNERDAASASRPKSSDATAAFVVPSKGSPVNPAGIGDKDDFDAGFNLP
ncbi:MAG: hypothetical protein LBR82_02045 [Desulfovibrio sp.]|jgi:hypothetical protein|nr:hypothetical protein [Desulfovibrio sp.]